MPIVIRHKGHFERSKNFLRRIGDMDVRSILKKYGERGVEALAAATPVKTGKTAASWYYTIEKINDGWAINWCNSNINEGVPIAIILQYGHGTGTGGYVEGQDYINPATRQVFEEMVDEAWTEVKR